MKQSKKNYVLELHNLIKNYCDSEHSSFSLLIYNFFDIEKKIFFDSFLNIFFNEYKSEGSDYIFFNAKSNFSKECIEKIIEFNQSTKIFDSSEKYRLVIIDNFDRIETSYLNMLLKIIEDSNSMVIFLFFASNIFKVAKTFKSRCFKIDFSSKIFNRKVDESGKLNRSTFQTIISDKNYQKSDTRRYMAEFYFQKILKYVEDSDLENLKSLMDDLDCFESDEVGVDSMMLSSDNKHFALKMIEVCNR
jgi:DNA polymerase III delta prime subunit